MKEKPFGYLRLKSGKFFYDVEGVPNLGEPSSGYIAMYTEPQLNTGGSEVNQLKQLRDELYADYHRPEGRWGLHGHSAVDDDYFCALEYVIGRIDTMLAENKQAEPVALDVGNLEYMGNSVSFIYQKMRAYKDGIGKVWQALRDNGIHPDGQTHAADAIRKALAQPARQVQPAVAQEPVACIGTNGELMWLKRPDVLYSKPVPLYTSAQAVAQEPVLQRVMGRLADLLDEDQFAEIEGIVVSVGITPPPLAAAINEQLLKVLVSFTKSEYIKRQHPIRYRNALAAIRAAEAEKALNSARGHGL